jgi:N-acetylglucosaminyl-diphospho-decaprenol L-rhamnosyltransferase
MPALATDASRASGGARLLISIVAYKAAGVTIDCLASIEPELASVPNLRVLVVDNASPDGAADVVARVIDERGWSGWASLVHAGGNHGFAAGNNVAIRAFLDEAPRRDYLLLLNPDTVVRPGALRRLLDFAITQPRAGIAGGRSEDLDATPQMCCFRFPNAINEVLGHLGIGPLDRLFQRRLTRLGVPEQPLRVDWVSGAFMLVRREVVEQLGLMDEGYFLYFEETDYSLCAQRAGWECWHVPDARVVHLVGQSSGVTVRNQAPRRMPGYWFESRRRYFVHHYGRAYAALTDLALVLACPLGRLRHRLQGKTPRTPPNFVRDLLRHSALWHRELPPPALRAHP